MSKDKEKNIANDVFGYEQSTGRAANTKPSLTDINRHKAGAGGGGEDGGGGGGGAGSGGRGGDGGCVTWPGGGGGPLVPVRLWMMRQSARG